MIVVAHDCVAASVEVVVVEVTPQLGKQSEKRERGKSVGPTQQ